jgi:glycosyltransferase involved in cell wall biosynthesis
VTLIPAVSVVIPTRDRPGSTKAAIESALAQTFAPHEVIVVDDSSARAVEYDHPRVRILRNVERRGGGAARNRGIDAAAGDWVAFLDSDDRWRRDKLERQLAQLGSSGPPAPALCCCNILVLEADDKAGRPHNRSAPSGDLSEWILIGGNTAQTSGLMLPTAAARRIRFDEGLARHEDWDFFLRAAAAGLAISYIHDPLVLYDDSARADRVSRGSAAADILAWIDGSAGGALVTAGARHEMLCRHLVAPGLTARPATAFASLARAILRGQLRAGPTLGWLRRSLARRAFIALSRRAPGSRRRRGQRHGRQG